MGKHHVAPIHKRQFRLGIQKAKSKASTNAAKAAWERWKHYEPLMFEEVARGGNELPVLVEASELEAFKDYVGEFDCSLRKSSSNTPNNFIIELQDAMELTDNEISDSEAEKSSEEAPKPEDSEAEESSEEIPEPESFFKNRPEAIDWNSIQWAAWVQSMRSSRLPPLKKAHAIIIRNRCIMIAQKLINIHTFVYGLLMFKLIDKKRLPEELESCWISRTVPPEAEEKLETNPQWRLPFTTGASWLKEVIDTVEEEDWVPETTTFFFDNHPELANATAVEWEKWIYSFRSENLVLENAKAMQIRNLCILKDKHLISFEKFVHYVRMWKLIDEAKFPVSLKRKTHPDGSIMEELGELKNHPQWWKVFENLPLPVVE